MNNYKVRGVLSRREDYKDKSRLLGQGTGEATFISWGRGGAQRRLPLRRQHEIWR